VRYQYHLWQIASPRRPFPYLSCAFPNGRARPTCVAVPGSMYIRAYCYPWLGKRWPTWLVELRKRSNWKRGRWTLRSEILTNDTGLLVTSIIQSTDLLGQYQRCIELPWLKSFYVSFLLCYTSVVLMHCYGNIIDLYNINNKVIPPTLCSFTPCTYRVVT